MTPGTGAGDHKLEFVVHPTALEAPDAHYLGIQELFRALVEDGERTEAICADIASAITGDGTACF
jgi:hypothetical protein